MVCPVYSPPFFWTYTTQWFAVAFATNGGDHRSLQHTVMVPLPSPPSRRKATRMSAMPSSTPPTTEMALQNPISIARGWLLSSFFPLPLPQQSAHQALDLIPQGRERHPLDTLLPRCWHSRPGGIQLRRSEVAPPNERVPRPTGLHQHTFRTL